MNDFRKHTNLIKLWIPYESKLWLIRGKGKGKRGKKREVGWKGKKKIEEGRKRGNSEGGNVNGRKE